MKLGLYAVRDTIAGAFNNPSPVINRGAAIRSFSDTVASGQNEWSKHPEDYVLFYLGEFDNVSGVIEVLDTPERVIGAYEVLAKAA